MQLNDNIRQYLKDKGYTQEGLGDSLGMSQPNFSRVLKKPISDALLARIAHALNTTPEVLQNYHLPARPNAQEPIHSLPSQRDELVTQLKDENGHLREEISRLHMLLAESLRGGGKS